MNESTPDNIYTLSLHDALPISPFYYKGNSDEGLFRSYSEVIQRVGDDRLRIYLYHIPPVAQVPITLTLIERLLKRSEEHTSELQSRLQLVCRLMLEKINIPELD